MKHIFRKLCCCLLLCMLLTPSAAAYQDVPENSWFANWVQKAEDLKLMNGTKNDEFDPYANLTRAMCSAILCRMAGGTAEGTPSFPDVSENRWYAPYIAWAEQNGIVSGFQDGTFRPENSVSRQEFAVMLRRFMEKFSWEVDTQPVAAFADEARTADWALPAVQFLHQAGIMEGDSGYFYPTSSVTRAQAAAMLSRLTEAWYIPIMGESQATLQQMLNYLLTVNPNVDKRYIAVLPYYLTEGKKEGVRGDVAFAQSCLETGNFGVNGSATQLANNNFGGFGVTATGVVGDVFPDPKTGVRAQIQHLKAYASKEALNSTCVDPRFIYVTRGSAPYVQWLGIQENPYHLGWATGANYGATVRTILKRILATPAS